MGTRTICIFVLFNMLLGIVCQQASFGAVASFIDLSQIRPVQGRTSLRLFINHDTLPVKIDIKSGSAESHHTLNRSGGRLLTFLHPNAMVKITGDGNVGSYKARAADLAYCTTITTINDTTRTPTLQLHITPCSKADATSSN